MRKKMKAMKIVLIIIGIMLAMTIAVCVVTKISLNDANELNAENTALLTENQQTVYVVATEDGAGITHGDIILDGVNVTPQTVFTGLESYNYITADDLGTTAIVDIYEGMTVMTNMVTPVDIAKDTREYEIEVCNLMVDQSENDYVDIRIMFPDGSDFLVLPKKQVKNLSLENCVFWTYLNEEEILRLASATIDAFSVTGTKIYATRYVESNLQDEAIPTYLVNSAVQDMMDTNSGYYDSNLMTKAVSTLNTIARQNLEAKLRDLSEEKLAAVNEGHGLEDTAKNSVMVGTSQYDYSKSESSTGGIDSSTTTPVTNSDYATEALEDAKSTDATEEVSSLTNSSIGN